MIKARTLFLKNVKDMQQQSSINGTSEMAMDEIDDIIAEVRKNKRGEAWYCGKGCERSRRKVGWA